MAGNLNIFVAGLSHHTAAVADRQRLALSADRTRQLLQAVHRETAVEEALVLQTCNRTEFYFVAADPRAALECLLGHAGNGESPAGLYRHDRHDAVRHLFRVAAGLDSQVVGESQILGQLKDAYRLALEERTARFFLNKLLHWSFRAAKRVRTATHLGEGASSVPQAAVRLAQQVVADLAGKSALLVGAGQTAELAARALLRAGVTRLTVANRTRSRAAELAEVLLRSASASNGQVDCPAVLRERSRSRLSKSRRTPRPTGSGTAIDAVALSELPAALADADVAICSTASPKEVLTYEALAPRLRRRRRPLLILDLAIPRDADLRLAELSCVTLCNLDDLDRLVDLGRERTHARAQAGEEIVAEETDAFARWADSLQIVPTIDLLKRRMEELDRAAARRYAGQFGDGQAEQLERFARSLSNKIVHGPVAYLREVAERGTLSDQLAAVDTVRRMFGLEPQQDGHG